jgi:hypothetical protein
VEELGVVTGVSFCCRPALKHGGIRDSVGERADRHIRSPEKMSAEKYGEGAFCDAGGAGCAPQVIPA